MNATKIIAGLDIGNGYVKALLKSTGDAQPVGARFASSVAYVTNSHDIKTPVNEIPAVIENIYDEMDASFDSPLVNNGTRRLFGSRGIRSGMSLEEFDVSSHRSKAQQPLSAILVLGTIAGKALYDYWSKNHALPTDMLQVSARIALALPIAEYIRHRKAYAEGFKNSTHVVSFHNFEQPVRVEIMFEDVQVQAEGAAAQYAINAEGVGLMDAMLGDVRRLGEALPGITAQDVLNATNTVSVDIGEGTVNFPVFQNGKFNAEASLTFDSGYGTVLNRALERLMDAGFAFKNRKDLGEFLQTQPTAISRPRYDRVKMIVDDEIQAFANEIAMQFVKVMSRVGSYIEVVYVYGGGASPLQSVLHKLLLDTAKNFGGADVSYPVLYLDSRYSQYLNRKGLFIVAEKLYERDSKKG